MNDRDTKRKTLAVMLLDFAEEGLSPSISDSDILRAALFIKTATVIIGSHKHDEEPSIGDHDLTSRLMRLEEDLFRWLPEFGVDIKTAISQKIYGVSNEDFGSGGPGYDEELRLKNENS